MKKLENATVEDQKAFNLGMEELLAKLSLKLSLSINKRPINIKLEDGTSSITFTDEPTIILQKEVIVPEVIKDETNKKD